jgi:hypothetical protein
VGWRLHGPLIPLTCIFPFCNTIDVRIVGFFAIGFLFLFCLLNKVHAGDARENPFGFYATDLTIFRTVNTLSCHPQNPFLHEVPHYVLFAPDIIYSDAPLIKGACWAYHNEGNTNFLTKSTLSQKGLPGSEDVARYRPASPSHHYTVMEFPNPKYDPAKDADCRAGRLEEQGAAAFCGKYLHMEGYANMWNLSVSTGTQHEVWYLGKEGIGISGKSISSVEQAGEVTVSSNTLTVYAGEMINDNNNNIIWNCDVDKKRLRDELRPCPRRSLGNKQVKDLYGPRSYYANPLLYPDIPHNRFTRNPRNKVVDPWNPYGVIEWYDHPEDPNDNNDDNWVKCKEKYSQLFGARYTNYDDYMQKFQEYIEDRKKNKSGAMKNVAISAYTPEGCDYPALSTERDSAGNFIINRKPTEPQQLAALLNNWTTDGVVSPSPSVSPSPTATPTPTGHHHRSDLNGDGILSVRDYNIFIINFGKTGPDLKGDLNNDGRVTLNDYNLFLSDFLGH